VAWETYGYPEAKEDDYHASGSIESLAVQVGTTRSIQIWSKEAAAGEGLQVRGLSGAPVMVDEAAVGLIRWATMSDDALGTSAGGTLYACAIETIYDRCADILPVPKSGATAPRRAGLLAQPAQPADVRTILRRVDQEVLLAYSDLDMDRVATWMKHLRLRNLLEPYGSPGVLLAEAPADLRDVECKVRSCQTAVVALSPTSLSQFQDHGDKVRRVMGILRMRAGYLAGCWLGAGPVPELPAVWGLSEVFDLSAWAPDGTPGVDPSPGIAAKLRAQGIGGTAPVVGLPCVVVAMTVEEAKELYDDPGPLAKKLAEIDSCQFQQLKDAIQKFGRKSTDEIYGSTREDWRPFPAAKGTVREVVRGILAELNRPDPNGRTPRVRVKAQYYPIDALLTKEEKFRMWGIYYDIAKSGCLVIVDELSMLHCGLRQGFVSSPLIHGEAAAVVTVSPFDPGGLEGDQILESQFRENLNHAFIRFTQQFDPQCELGVADERRLKRWLHGSIPRALDRLINWRPVEENLSNFTSKMGEEDLARARAASDQIW
jgi:hypothetical protein